MPARICFKGKVAPIGIERPACSPCNSASAASEQVAAFHIRMADWDGRNFDAADTDKLITAICNNLPETLPDWRLSAREKRRFLDDSGIKPPPGVGPSELPIVTISTAAHAYLDLFGQKLLLALYYEGVGEPLPIKSATAVHWAQLGTPGADYLALQAAEWFGAQRQGERPNVDIGDQYRVRSAFNLEGRIFGAQVSFGASLSFFMMAMPLEKVRQAPGWDWNPHAPLYELGSALAYSRRRQGR